MEVILAETAGFCFGVKRAVDQVYEQIKTGKKIYTFGPIIHNENVVEDLEKKGVQVIENVDELATLTEGSVVIRSHGVSKEKGRLRHLRRQVFLPDGGAVLLSLPDRHQNRKFFPV